MERAKREEEVLRNDARVAMNWVPLLWKDSMKTFVGLLIGIVREQWRKRVDDDGPLEFVKSGYMLECA